MNCENVLANLTGWPLAFAIAVIAICVAAVLWKFFDGM